jgi:excinuclease ABC subunit C
MRLPVIALAKEKEEIFIPGYSQPIILPSNSPALHLLQRTRDEAHRFALGYHTIVRRKTSLFSRLDNIPNIGDKRKKALLKKFGSVRGIKEASVEELVQVPGMTRNAAQSIKESL